MGGCGWEHLTNVRRDDGLLSRRRCCSKQCTHTQTSHTCMRCCNFSFLRAAGLGRTPSLLKDYTRDTLQRNQIPCSTGLRSPCPANPATSRSSVVVRHVRAPKTMTHNYNYHYIICHIVFGVHDLSAITEPLCTRHKSRVLGCCAPSIARPCCFTPPRLQLILISELNILKRRHNYHVWLERVRRHSARGHGGRVPGRYLRQG